MIGKIPRSSLLKTAWFAVALLPVAAAAILWAQIEVVPFRNYVSDYVGIIPAEVQQKLNALLKDLDGKTGVQIAVVIIQSTEGVPTADYAVEFGHTWEIGTKGKDNGVVFLVAIKDREMFIATGDGIEPILPDDKVGRIRDEEILPLFRRGEMVQGVVRGTMELAQEVARAQGLSLNDLAPEPDLTRRPATKSYGDAWVLIVLLFLLAWLVSSRSLPFLLMGYGMRGGSFGGGFGSGGFGGGFGGGGFGGKGAGGKWYLAAIIASSPLLC